MLLLVRQLGNDEFKDKKNDRYGIPDPLDYSVLSQISYKKQ